MQPRALLLAAAIVSSSACSEEPAIHWEEIRTVAGRGTETSRLALAPAGVELSERPPRDSAPAAPGACPGSVVLADDGIGGAFAAWWAPRDDGSVVLLVARRGRDAPHTWGAPVVADDRDRGRRACDRPPPAIAADGRRGHVHLVYFLEPADGPGVWAGHSMEDGGYFHGPIAVVYGDRPVRGAVDVDGDLVVMAYEDPNSRRPRLSIAISETAGHLIEHRLAGSPAGSPAAAPLIAVADGRVALAWSPAAGLPGPPAVLVRLGVLGERVQWVHPGGDE